MKKSLLVTITLFITQLTFAQLWDTVNINTSNTLSGIGFVDPNIGVAVGYSSTNAGGIWRTTDGGASWTSITVPASTDKLNDVFFTDAQTGYAAGDSGLVLKTADAGATWTTTTGVTSRELRSIYFIDANNGYVGGSNGTVLKTTDGGQSWNILSDTITGTTQSIYSIWFINASTGYITGDGGMIKMTSDGGSTWTHLPNPYLGFFNGRSIWFTDANTGYISGQGGRLIKTTDAGLTWTALNTWIGENLVSIEFTTQDTGYVAGDNGRILKTTDAGFSWLPADSNITTQSLTAISFANTSIGYIAGTNGTVLKTINGATPVHEIEQVMEVSAYPNPFNGSATVKYRLAENANVNIEIYDISGRNIFIMNEEQQAGEHLFNVNAATMRLERGIYFLRLSAANGSKVLKLVVN